MDNNQLRLIIIILWPFCTEAIHIKGTQRLINLSVVGSFDVSDLLTKVKQIINHFASVNKSLNCFTLILYPILYYSKGKLEILMTLYIVVCNTKRI